MATLTVAIDPAVLEAIKREAECRKVTLDQFVTDSLSGVAHLSSSDEDGEALIRLMYEDRVGTIDRPLTRDEIYAERTWPRL